MPLKDKEAHKQYCKKYNAEHKEAIKQQNKQFREANKEQLKTIKHLYYINNKDKFAKKSKEYYEENKDVVKKNSNAYYKLNKHKVLSYQHSNKHRINQIKKVYNKKNKGKIREWKKKEYEKQGWKRMAKKEYSLKLEAYKILGNKCAICGFSDLRALQIDHINGGGVAEHKEIGLRRIRKKIINGEIKDYQLLCANCNWIKRSEKGETGNRKGRKNRSKWIESNLGELASRERSQSPR